MSILLFDIIFDNGFYFSDRPIDLLTFAKKAGISKIFGGSKDNRLDGSSLFQLMSWNMDAISASCANLKFLIRLPDCTKVMKKIDPFVRFYNCL